MPERNPDDAVGAAPLSRSRGRVRPRAIEVSSVPYAVVRLAPDAAVPAWLPDGSLTSVTRTPEELSIVCRADAVPASVECRRGFRALRVRDAMDFSEVGVLASLAAPLAAAGVSLLSLSTWLTDYLFVSERDLEAAIAALRSAGHSVHHADTGRW
jgi:hypothetical protein